MDISINRLQQLVTVARSGSFSRAAAELNISQPALSRSIAALEDRYGFPIFTRTGHGVELTPAGSQVVAMAHPLLQDMRVFDHNLKLFGSGKAGQLKLGVAPLLASHLLARFAKSFFAADSSAELRAVIRPGGELLDILKNDQIEVFFFPESHVIPGSDIEVTQIGTMDVSCVVRRDHPLTRKSLIYIDDIRSFPWASSVVPPIPPDFLNPARFLCDNYHVLRETVLESDFICICSSDFAAQYCADGSLQMIDIIGLSLPPVPIYMAKLLGRMLSPLAIRATAQIGELLKAF